MANVLITSLTEKTNPVAGDFLHVVDDPSVTPLSKKAQVSSVIASLGMSHDLLYEETLTANGQFDIASIPQTYDDLKILMMVRGTLASTVDIVYMFFNGDFTVGNYHSQRYYSGNGSSTAGNEYAAPNTIYSTAANAPANSFCQAEIYIQNYTDTNYLKTAHVSTCTLRAAGEFYIMRQGVTWVTGGTAAINRITMRMDGHPTDQIAIGSRFRLVGIKYA